MRFELIDRRRRTSLSSDFAGCLMSARVAISPGDPVSPAGGNGRIWCCLRMSVRPSPCRTAPMGARA